MHTSGPLLPAESLELPSVSQSLSGFLDRICRWLESRISWTRHSPLSALFLLAIALLVAWPNFAHFYRGKENWAEAALDWEIQHPFEAIPVQQFAHPGPDMAGTLAHLRKRTYRITVPLAAHLLRLHIRGAEALSFAFSCAFVWMIFLNFRIASEDLLTAILLSVAVAGSFVIQWGLNDFFFFDGTSYFFLAAACFTRRSWVIAICLTLGAFSDERAILAAPLVYLVHSGIRVEAISLLQLFRPNRRQLGTMGGVLLFVLLRIILGLHVGQLFDRAQVGPRLLFPNLLMLPLAIVLAYKGASMLIGLAFLWLGLRRSSQFGFILLAAAVPCVLASLLVSDLSRSLVYAFPLLFICARLLRESLDLTRMRRLSLCAAAAGILLPTYYIWEFALVTYTPLPILLLEHLRNAVHLRSLLS